MKLSNIQSSEEDLKAYYEQLRAQHVTPAWIAFATTIEPKSKAVPYVWHWRDLRPQAMRAAELIGTEQAERRVLRLTNPELPGVSASNTMVANIQIVMPGEIARAHRHSPSALYVVDLETRSSSGPVTAPGSAYSANISCRVSSTAFVVPIDKRPKRLTRRSLSTVRS